VPILERPLDHIGLFIGTLHELALANRRPAEVSVSSWNGMLFLEDMYNLEKSWSLM
jgi:hypothetical protein